MKENLIQEKSYKFALRIVGLYRYLVKEKREFVLSRQVLRSGTSVGANVEEAVGGQSRNDFSAKLAIAYKEARETKYWLRLLFDSGLITSKMAESLLADCDELLRIIGKIQTTIKNKKIRNS